jgi:hypothetical protein
VPRWQLSACAPGKAGHDRDQFDDVNRFGDMRLKTGEESAPPIFGASQRSYGGSRYRPALLGRQRANRPNQAVTILFGHADVRDEYVGMLARDQLAPGFGGIRCDDPGALIGQDAPGELARIGFIVHVEHGHAIQSSVAFTERLERFGTQLARVEIRLGVPLQP